MTKNELRLYRDIKSELRQLRETREFFYSRAERCTRAPSADTVHSGASDVLPGIMDKLDELEAVIRPKEAALVELSVRIERAIESLPITERIIMRMRYTEGKQFKGWVAVAMALGLSVDWVKHKHGNILEKLKHDTPQHF